MTQVTNTIEYDYSQEKRRVFFLIDSKIFYASMESVQRGLNPLKSILMVMSEQANTNGGLVLAASPMAKKELGISNVMRQRDVPDDPRLIKVQPRMNLYIQENLRINTIYLSYVDEPHLLPYSIDESILDMTDTWAFFGESPRIVARQIQERVCQETGIYLMATRLY